MSDSPSFKKPPVVETVLGVQFAPLDDWGIAHFGLFWQEIRKDFPKHQVMPPLMSQMETFDPVFSQPEVRVELMQRPEARCWYLSEDGRQVVQVQKERFIYNWRLETDAPYPRYDAFVRPAFEFNWSRFAKFVEREVGTNCQVVQCEVTYVNHIPKGEGWNEMVDLQRVFTILGSTGEKGFLPAPESTRFNVAYAMPNRMGRLRISANHAVR